MARRGVQAAARRLTAAGALPTPDDVRFLTLSELTTALREGGAGVRKTVVDRRRSRARAAAAWRRGVGTSSGAAGDLKGLAGSPGVATGPVKIIAGPAEFGKLEPGDILVCSFTDPAWTPRADSRGCRPLVDTTIRPPEITWPPVWLSSTGGICLVGSSASTFQRKGVV